MNLISVTKYRGLQWLALFAAVIPIMATVNTPPRLTRNAAIPVEPGATTLISSNVLLTVDTETVDPSEIIYKIAPGATNGVSQFGELFLGNRLLKADEDFSQEDINNGRMSYKAAAVVSQPGDNIPFNVRDFDGALAADGPFTVFSLRITFSNARPVASNLQFTSPLGGRITNSFAAFNAETYQNLSYRLVTLPTNGTVSLVNSNTGTFHYQANLGVAGEDTFTFQVSDGSATSLNPGTVTISITNTIPVIPAQRFVVEEDDEISGRILVTDVDRPSQTLNLNIVSAPLRGTLESFDPATGRFIYRPQVGRFGYDFFIVAAQDGASESAYQRIDIDIKPIPDEGSILITGREAGVDPTSSEDDRSGIYVVNPINGDTYLLFNASFLRETTSLVYDARREEIVFAASGGGGMNFIGAIDLHTGEPRMLASTAEGLQFPLHLSIDRNHNILLADGPGGVKTINPVTREIKTVASGNLIQTASAVNEEADGSLIVLDIEGLFEDNADLIKVDTSGIQSLFFKSSLLLDPTDMLDVDDNTFYLLDRGGLFQLDKSQEKLTLLVQPSNFESIAKEMVFDGVGGIVITDLGTKLVRYDISTKQVITVQMEIPVEPSAIATFNQPPTLAIWNRTFFTFAELANPALEATLWGSAADSDNDGLPNYAEFAVGFNPREIDSSNVLRWSYGTSGQSRFLTLHHRVRHLVDAKVVLEGTRDFITWSPVTAVPFDEDALGTLFEEREYRINIDTAAESDYQFFRLKVIP